MAATPYPGYPTMRTRSPAERSASRGNLPGWRLRLIRATQRCVPVARLSAALAWETFPDGGYALSGLPNDASREPDGLPVPVARLSAARAGETFPDGGYALSGLPNDAYP
ncbi:hypothetical protein RFC90_003035 [Klebsiella aerogenes]|nr:hypothetical protein [Klebsiella aerogenes]